MKVIDVIESKVWKNKNNGRTASIYGCHPAVSDADRSNWELVVVGWTWKCDDGTVGLCRVPAKTREEALAVMEKFNKRD